MRKPLLVSSLLVLFAGMSWWWVEVNQDPEIASESQGSRKIDYYLRDVTITRMDAKGVRIQTLRSPKVSHFMDDDTTTLEKPMLTVYKDQQPPWEIRAEQGWVSADRKEIYLTGEVHITRDAGLGVRPVQLDTHNVRVQPDDSYVETDENVSLRSQGDWLHATGMRAWLRYPAKIKLLKDVTSFYVPPS